MKISKTCIVYTALFVISSNLFGFQLFRNDKGGVPVDIGISEKNRQEVSKILNRLLSNEYLIYTKSLKFHWNVVGHQFNDLHKFFKDIYEKTFNIVDDIAERVRTLGYNSLGTLSEFSKYTTLKEYPGSYPTDLEMIRELLVDHEAIIKELRSDAEAATKYEDAGTNNFLISILEQQEKTAWMLRAHLTK